ncbi:MAG: lyase family protein [Acidimicrobiales bacterium]
MTTPSVPLYGEHTRLAVENFDASGVVFPLPVVHAVARIKAAAAGVLCDLVPERLPSPIAEAIATACEEIRTGAWDDQFVVDVFQTGSATSTHMNVNEVVAARAEQLLDGTPVHPIDHVNLGQSSNDVMPSGSRIAVLEAANRLVSALARLERELGLHEVNSRHVVKVGRTHMQDAVPITLGQEFGGYRQQVVDGRSRIDSLMANLGRLPLGGTAVGNGLNAPPGYAERAIHELAVSTGLDLTPCPNHFALQGAHDDLVDLSGRAKTVACSLDKIANDLRLMASGPTAGLGEIELPELQPGSSIMPGKVNPVIPEVVNQIVARVIGNDAGITHAGSRGALELNTYLPLIVHDLLDSLDLLTAAADMLAEKVVAKVVPHLERCRALAEGSQAIVTALAPLIGYDAAAVAQRDARASGEELVDLVADRHGIDEAVLRDAVDLFTMALGTVEYSRPALPFEDPDVPTGLLAPDERGMIGP